MAARKKSKSGDWQRWLILGCTLAVGVAGGYAWRSFAPLALPGDPRLSGAEDSMPGSPSSSDLQKRLAMYSNELEDARSEASKLREKLNKVEQVQQRAETDLAEIQIKSLLSDE